MDQRKKTFLGLVFVAIIKLCFSVNYAQGWELKTSFDGDPGDANFFISRISSFYSHSGSNSVMFPLIAGQENDGQQVYQLGGNLYEGDELWVRVYVYPPQGFRWDANPITKILRIAAADPSGQGASYHSILSTRKINYGCGESTNFGCMVTGSEMNSSENPPPICQNKNTNDGGAYLAPGQWHCIELYLKISSTSGIMRAWHNGILRNEYLYPTIPIGGYIPQNRTDDWIQSHLLGWWNGGPVQDQEIYFDDFVIRSDVPSNRDSSGNSMIGPTDWNYQSDLPPSSPQNLTVH